MATTTVQTVDLSQALAEVLKSIEGLRTYWFVSDTVRPPANGAALVVMQPSVDYTDNLSGFCAATWTYPLVLVVNRGSERDAQTALSSYLQQITSALSSAEAPGVQTIEPVDARPSTANVGGTDLPSYQINVRIRA